MTIKPTDRIESIQVLRALAVVAVVLSHTFHEVAQLLSGYRVHFDEKLFPGDFGVDLFFVISGFIMVHVSWEAFGRKGATLDFLRRRVIRIVPLYWLATTAMIGVILLLPGAVDTATRDPGQWLQSYLFWPHERASDGMMRPVLGLGWSLQYEMFFYLLFAICLFLPRRAGLVAAIAAIALAHFAGRTALGEIPAVRFLSHPMIFEFAAGVALGWAYRDGARVPPFLAAALVAVALVLLLTAPSFNADVEANRHFHYGIPALLIVAGITLFAGSKERRGNPLLVEMGETSYSTYLSHPFTLGVLTLVAAKVQASLHLPPYLFSAAYGAAALVACLLVGHATHHLVDRRLTRWASRLLSPRTRVSPGLGMNAG